ncbi:NAD(P)H-dependent oxidoreductase [Devosia sp. ZB163]|uniref:NADPH-dependent FMN reductase n=1 Tax=Devosia sp. ZB163 TaxID=3025938 RepID=UPI002360C6B6|nr:NAD(P)H-dependent oxidoreductase [Devosia sp. ZB163]MDC9822607.1 NAD(P)H-dependent oxidoreductase [Devosia sp. ZB163]
MTTEAPSPKTAITLCGSLRKESINEPLRRLMSNKLREAGVEVTDLDLRDFDMPIFNQDIEETGETPEAAKRLADMFRSYDIVFIASPEYNGGVTPLIVNMISWVSRQKPNPFKHAIFGIGGVSDGKYATIFALSHLRDSLSKLGALVVPTLLGIGPYPDVFDENGEPNEANIKWKVGQTVRELTHFSRGGI